MFANFTFSRIFLLSVHKVIMKFTCFPYFKNVHNFCFYYSFFPPQETNHGLQFIYEQFILKILSSPRDIVSVPDDLWDGMYLTNVA